jgi:hypothetical protein
MSNINNLTMGMKILLAGFGVDYLWDGCLLKLNK